MIPTRSRCSTRIVSYAVIARPFRATVEPGLRATASERSRSKWRTRQAISHLRRQQASCDHDSHDLVRPLEDLMDTQITEISLDGIFLGVAVTAVQLQRLVADLETGVGRKPFCHCAMHRRFRIARVERNRRSPDHQPGGFEFRCHVCHPELKRLEFRERFPELLANPEMRFGGFKACTRAAQRAGADIDAPAVQCLHRDLEAVTLVSDEIANRDATIFEDDGGGRLAVPTELLLLLAKGKARCAFFNDDARNSARARPTRSNHANIDVACTAARDERLGAVQDVMAAVAFGSRAKRGSVRSRARFGQAVAAEVLHRGELWQETVTQFVIGKGVDHPRGHVMDGDVSGRGRVRCGEFLENDCGIEPRECRATDVVAHIDAGETLFGCFPQGIPGKDMFFVPLRGVRKQLRFHEAARGVLEGALVFIELEIHGGLSRQEVCTNAFSSRVSSRVSMMARSIWRISRQPQSAMVVSSSLRMMSSASVTPSPPSAWTP